MKRKKYTKEEKEMVKAIRKLRHFEAIKNLTGKSHKRPAIKEARQEVVNPNAAIDKDFSKAILIQKKCWFRN